MYRTIALATMAAAISMLGSVSAQNQSTAQAKPVPPFAITSPGFDDGGVIPEKFTGPTPTSFQNSPPLNWANTPEGTVSFVLLLHDLDGSINHGTDDITHWLIYNIPGTAHSLPEGIGPTAQLPDGSVQAPNQRKTPGYLGPGARGSYHHYAFELYALDIKLSLAIDAPRVQVTEAMQGHILGKTVLVGKYERQD